MKRHLFFLILLSYTIGTACAQDDFSPELSVGTTHGVSLSQMSFVPDVSQELLPGYNGGIVARYISEWNLGLQVELSFSQRGWKEKWEETEYKRSLNYIELPIMSHIYFGRKKFRTFINLGPKFSYYLGDNKPAETEESPDRLHMNVARKFDYGIVAGLGMGLRIGKFFYQIEGRYGFGLGDIFENSKSDPYSRSAHRNLTVNASVLYIL